MSVDNTLSFDSHVLGKSSLSEILKLGARRLLMQAVEREVEEYIHANSSDKDSTGRKLVVRNGYSKMRTVQTGLGPIDISMPRVNDKRPDKYFSSKILPPYLRKTKEIEELIPWLYLKGISTGDFSDALVSLVGENARGFSANTVVKKSGKKILMIGIKGRFLKTNLFIFGLTAFILIFVWKMRDNAFL
jgi:transposase-like protein